MSVKVYGIKNCDSVKKTIKFLKSHSIAYDFIDFKEQPPTAEQIQRWSNAGGIKKLFNTRSTTYRTLKLKEKNLTDEEKITYMIKEPLLIKRAVLEKDDKILVGYDEKIYKKELL
jgi:Spx/MgsR family transcriptional regulator